MVRVGVTLVLGGLLVAQATETENLNFSFLPVPNKVVVDGKVDDWDLSAGVFACGDAENAREKFGVWIHGMYDAERLYLLARWVDPTPMNNPGSTKGDYGFRGDCLQFRIVTAPDVTVPAVSGLNRSRTPKDPDGVRVSHWDCWRDRDGLDSLGGSYGVAFKEGGPAGVKEGGGAPGRDAHGRRQDAARAQPRARSGGRRRGSRRRAKRRDDRTQGQGVGLGPGGGQGRPVLRGHPRRR